MSILSTCRAALISIFLFLAAASASAEQRTYVRVLPHPTGPDNIKIETVYGNQGATIKATSGTPPFAASIDDPAVATVKPVDETSFMIDGIATGITFLRITDSTGKTLECELLVKRVMVIPKK